jgi:hypothetical protein
MLATLPRNKWDELTWAALGGAASQLPGAIGACAAGLKRNPFTADFPEVMAIVIFVAFFACFLARRRTKGGKTSQDLLTELRRGSDRNDGV